MPYNLAFKVTARSLTQDLSECLIWLRDNCDQSSTVNEQQGRSLEVKFDYEADAIAFKNLFGRAYVIQKR